MRDRFSMILIGATVVGGGVVSMAACSTSGRDTHEAAGEVVLNSSVDSGSAKPAVRWLTDANVLALLGVMNARQIAAADVELEAWHVDSVRAFAASVAREHAELQHAVDSVSERSHLPPIAPALAQTISSAMQSQVDLLRRTSGRALDRVFVREQVASNQLMADYIGELAVVAERSEIRGMLASAKDRVNAELRHARVLQTRLAVADSTAAADSAAKLARLAAKAAKLQARSAVP